jgi:IgA-specific serine endopeptidase
MKTIAVLLVAGLGVAFLLLLARQGDRQAAEEALLQISGVELADRNGLEQSFARAKAKALAIRSDDLREQTLAAITTNFLRSKEKLDKTDELKKQALALMLPAQETLASLTEARGKAEELRGKIQIANEAAALEARLDELFERQRKTIEERIAAEEKRKAEEELARQIETARLEQEERDREADREAERERAAEAEQQRRAQEPKDCCCKMKFDTGLIFTNYEWEYKRFDKKKCADPGFWDNHKEGWCVPDSYCN